MRKLILTAIALLTTVGALQTVTSSAQAAAYSCANVRCITCPEGYHLKMKWPNCCECIPN